MLIWLTLLAWLLWIWLRGVSLSHVWRRLRLSRTWIDVGVAGLLIAGGLSTLAASHLGPASYEWRVLFLASAILYLNWRLTALLPNDKEGLSWRWPAIDAFLIGGLVMAVIGVIQWIAGHNLITAEGVARARSLYGSPNNLSLYLERIIPIAVALGIGAGGRRRLLYLLALIPLLLAIFLTYSRGAWLIGLPAALLAMGIAAGGRWRPAAVAALLLAAVALVPLLGTERFGNLLELDSGTTFFRLKLWQGAWNMAQDHLLLGVGPDNFLYEYRTRYVLPSAWQELNLSHPHNIFLDLLTRVGLVGTGAMGILLISLWRRLWEGSRPGSPVGRRMVFIGLLGSLTASLAHGLIDNSFFLIDLALALILTAGLAATWPAAILEPENRALDPVAATTTK